MAGAVRRFGSMGGFSKHRAGSGGGDYLKKWKEKGAIEVWLHVKELPLAMWRHQIPMIVILDDKNNRGQKIKHAWSKNFVCYEDEGVLEQQYFRTEQREPLSPRKHPPKKCGVCKLIEWCYQQCHRYEYSRDENAQLAKDGKKPKPFAGIKFTTPMFRFEGDDPKETQLIHIGGICKLFDKDHNDAQKADMAEAKIRKSEAWKENMFAKCQYAMCVVNNDAPDDGVQIAVETSSLGDKVKEVLDDMIESDKRDYERSPYAIKWKFNESETDLNKKYKALPMRETALTPRIKKLITGEAPTEALNKMIERFNQQTVRAQLEAHCLLPKGTVPWDELFPTVEQSAQWEVEEAEAEAEAAALDAANRTEQREDGDHDSDDATGSGSDEDEVFACNNEACDAVVKATDAKCPKCGEVYEVEADAADAQEPEPAPEPAPPPLRKRAAASPAAHATGAAATKKATTSKAAPTGADTDQDSDVPF